MQPTIQQFAIEAGISIDEAHYFVSAISKQLVSKIPALREVIEDILENVDDETLKEHINKMILRLQQEQSRETFKTWIMPPQVGHVNFPGSDTIF